MPERDRFDLLLDDALRSYGEAMDGLEERVLTQIANSATRSKRRKPVWAALLPLAACLLLALILPGVLHHAGQQVAHISSAPPAPTKMSNPTADIEPVKRNTAKHARHASSIRRATVAPPKLDVFPTPTPLTQEERAFVEFSAAAPASERNAYVEARQKLDEPIHIAAIHIQPIPSSAEGDE